MAAQNFGCLKKTTQNHRCIVVSAVGKEHPFDQKTTDLLAAHFGGDASAWQKIQQKYTRVVQVNGVNIDVEKLLWEALRRSKKHNLAYCLSLGEELSAKIAAAFLNCEYIEAQKCIKFGVNGRLLWRQTKSNLKSAFDGLPLGVIGGFYGGIALNCSGKAFANCGRAVFSRGGGDVSGAICAAATNSVLYENRTDVNGVFSANPKQVFGAQTIPTLCYDEMFLLSKSGAEVLHPDAVRICGRFGIPICVCGFDGCGANNTLVSNCPSGAKFLAVTEKRIDGKTLTTVLHGMTFAEVSKKISTALEVAEKLGKKILQVKIGNLFAEICTEQSILNIVFSAFAEQRRASVSFVQPL